MMRTG